MDDGSPLPWIFIALLLFLAMYFAAAESAYSSVSRVKLKTELDRGNRSAKKAMLILDNFNKAITTILIGTNIVHAATAAIVTVMVTKRWGVSVVALSTIITTVVVFFAGEMLPKSLAKKYSLRFALSTAGSLRAFMVIFTPLSYALTAIGQAAAKRTRGDSEVTVTEDELYDIIETMKDEGELDPERGSLVHSALVFADVTAESIITPRVDVEAVDVLMPPEKILEFVKASKHSRFPVYEGSVDNIVGILQIRKFIKLYLRQGGELDVRSILDETHFTHQSTKIDELLSVMSRKRLNMAVITDNYGGTLGIVTVEDILEELVGDIWDEDDDIEESFAKLDDGSFLIDPELSIEEAFELMGFDDPDDFDFEHKLLGEWVFEHFDSIPEAGESFVYNGLEISVAAISHNRIVTLSARILPAEKPEGGGRK